MGVYDIAFMYKFLGNFVDSHLKNLRVACITRDGMGLILLGQVTM
jgi:hypothetical protein